MGYSSLFMHRPQGARVTLLADNRVARRLRPSVAFRGEALLLVGLGLVLSALAVLFPPSGDDWQWGARLGITRLHEHFANYNGRYVGNLTVLLLTRTPWLTPLVVGFTLVALLFLLAVLTRTRTFAGYLVGAMLLVAMPRSMWQETVVWLSGFSNYTTGTFALLVFMVSVQRDWLRSRRLAVPAGIGLLLVGFAGQLFVEHVSLFIVLASLVNLALHVRRRRRVSAVALIWVVASLSGAAVMFSNSRYRAAANGSSTYQGIGARGDHSAIGGLLAIIREGAGEISQLAVTTNTVLNVSLFVLVLGLAVAAHKASAWNRGVTASVALAAVALAGGAAVSSSIDQHHYISVLTPWSWICALPLVVALVLAARSLVIDSTRSRDVVVLTLSAVALAAPMAAIHPYGPRNFLPSYVVLVAVALTLLAEVQERVPAPAMARAIAGAAAAVGLVALAGYFAVFAIVHKAADDRVAQIRHQVAKGRTVVWVPTLPFRDYVHVPDPVPGVWEQRYKSFYHLPAGLQIRLIDRDDDPALKGTAGAE